ncbi:hypothetical protein LguiB_012791 [Lonicera macranthoides]
MSDRNNGLINAIREWFPGHPHAFCYHHLKHNIEARFPGSNNRETRETVIQLFTSCAYTLSKKRFHKKLDDLKREGGDVIKSFLSGLPFENWANSYFPGQRYGYTKVTVNQIVILIDKSNIVTDVLCLTNKFCTIFKIVNMDSVACINYRLAVIVLVTVWLADIIKVLAATSTNITANHNNSSKPPWFNRESEALEGIRRLWNVDSSTSHCKWVGIGCNEAGSVTSIHCPYYYVRAHIYELNLTSFPNLEVLDLSDCWLDRTIPYEIGMLSKLTKLSLSYNSLSGSLPSSLAILTSLTFLDISHNSLSGSIPSSVGFMTHLTYLDLSGNQLTGSIPSELGNLKILEYLHLGENNFAGPIPSSVGFMTHLTYLNLFGNQLTGSIPSELGNLKILEYLDLHYNRFSGPIPSTIGLLTKLTYLELHDNFLYGTVLANLSYLSNINFIDFSCNKLVGPFPTGLCELCSSSKINLVGNDGFEGNLGCEFEMKDQNKKMSRVRHLIPIIILPITISLALLIILAHRFFSSCKAVKNKSVSVTMKHGNMCSIWNYDGTIAYEDIIRSTNDFDIEHCIGTGDYGSVYRAQLPSGKVVALKKLHRFEAE